MSQTDFIRDIAKYGLENDQQKLLEVLNELIEHSKKTKKINFALQLQSLLRDSIRQQSTNKLTAVGSAKHYSREEDKEINEFILDKLTSDYTFENIVCSEEVKSELKYFIKEHKNISTLKSLDLPVANKLLFYGPSGCGKTLAAYVLAGELNKLMMVINLGAIVSSKLGETSKNLAKVFRRAATEDCIVFLDEFDSLGKIRDYNQDHGEMKRVVNTLLQLFDYLPQECIVIAATNHSNFLDNALLRRFENKIEFSLPDKDHVREIIMKTISNDKIVFDKPYVLDEIIDRCIGLSYFAIQKTLITSIKRSLLESQHSTFPISIKISTHLWIELIEKEKSVL